MLTEERFEEQILITTTCLDAGVNIKDDEVKHIICDIKDVGSLVQCIGRKRLKNDEKIHLYIKTMSNEQLGGIKSQLKVKIGMADYLRKHTVKEYISKYPRTNDYSDIVYDDTVSEEDKCTKKVNDLMYFKTAQDICDIDNMLVYKKYGYCKYLANKFNIRDNEGKFNYRIRDEEYLVKSLEKYLDGIVEKWLFKDEQYELINKIEIRLIGELLKTWRKNWCNPL